MRRRLLAWLGSRLVTWVSVLIAVVAGLMLTALVDRITDLSGLRNGFLLLGVFLALSGVVLIGARVGGAALQRHVPGLMHAVRSRRGSIRP